MDYIPTGVYKKIVTREKKEIILDRRTIERKIVKLQKFIEKRTPKMSQTQNSSIDLNLERIKRIKETGKMLIEGYSRKEIENKFGLKPSTIETYVEYFTI